MTARFSLLPVGSWVAASLSLAGGCVGSMSASPTPGTESLCEATFAATLRGRVVDEAGGGVVGAQVQACITAASGSAFCLDPVLSRADGVFDVAVPEAGRCFEEAVVRITRTGEAGRWATTYCTVDGALDGDALDLAYDATLIELPPAAVMPPEGSATSSRTVQFGAGVALTLSPASLVREDAYPLLRARALPASEGPCSIGAPSGLRFDGLVAMGPEVEVDGSVTLALPVSAAEGSEVEVYTIGGTYTVLEGTQIPEGRFARVATSTVTGGRISVSGLPILSWVGYRVADVPAPVEPPPPVTPTEEPPTPSALDLPSAGSCPATASGREVGDVVAELSFPSTDGGVFALRDHCEDELVVVYHYVDGCGSCAAFLTAEGNTLAAELASHGYRFVVAVARVNDLDGSSRPATVLDAQRIQDELGLTTTVVADQQGSLLRTFSRSGPSYVLMLRRGNVIAQPWGGYGGRVSSSVRSVMAAIEAE